jgi:hypothetical protein
VTWLGVAVLAIAAVIAVWRDDAAPSPPPPLPPTPSPPAPALRTGPPWGLVPPARTVAGDRTAVHLVFPDGSTAEMSYSTGMGLMWLGVRPHTSGSLTGPGGEEECCLRPVYAPPPGGGWFATGGPPIGRLGGVDGGRVTVVPPAGAGPQSDYLVFDFDRWRVGVETDREDRMDAAQRRSWAGNLRGRVTAGGFLVLRGQGPLRLAVPPDESVPSRLAPPPHEGPQLRFGRGFTARYGIGSFDDPSVIFEPVTHCQGKLVIAGYLETAIRESVCKGGTMRVWAGGDDAFVQRVLPDIRVWNVRLAAH